MNEIKDCHKHYSHLLCQLTPKGLKIFSSEIIPIATNYLSIFGASQQSF